MDEHPFHAPVSKHVLPAAALAVGDRVYAGTQEWPRILEIHYSTPDVGQITFVTDQGELPPVGANAKCTVILG